MPSLLHQIRRGMGQTISGILPQTPHPIGMALMQSDIDPVTGAKTFVLAEGRADGFMTRDSRTTIGLTDTEQLFGFGLETAFLVGREGSIEPGFELEVEGTDYIKTSSTGAISSGTPIDTDLSFSGGKFCVAQADQIAQFRLKKIMTPVVDSGNLRIFVVAIRGYKA